MYYSVRHVTRFRYSDAVSESAMEVRMRPLTDGLQRCLSFDLRTQPRTFILSYVDDLGNAVHHFDVPDRHDHLTIRAESLVETVPHSPLPETLDPDAWSELDTLTASDEYYDMLAPSTFAQPTDRLLSLQRELRVARGADPLSTLRELNSAVHDTFDYDTQSTGVNSPIDEALEARRGVCQDFAHITIALVRRLGIPCRYVSGYLYHRGEHDRSAQDATHAWAETLLPRLGWVGLDPTNNLIAGERHIRVATGRDYADVPPTRGVFKGHADTELAVAVRVTRSEAPPVELPEYEESEPDYRPAQGVEGLPDGALQEQPQQ